MRSYNARMAHTFDICIRGAGIVGRTLALLLARERLRVALVANPTPQAAAAPDVRAYALNTASRTLLESLRSWPDPQHATAVARMDVFGDKDGAVHFDAAAQGAEALAWIVDVPALEQRLAEAVRYQPQVEVVQAPVNAALTVVCEGRASSTRAEFGVDFEVTPYTQHAIATRLECEHPHGQVARQWFLPDGILAFLPLGGPEGRSVAVVWSVDREQVAPLLALLRSVSAIEAYQSCYRDSLTLRRAAELLVLRPDLPRSLKSCLDEISVLLPAGGRQVPQVRRRVAELEAMLTWGDIDDVLAEGLPHYLAGFLDELHQLDTGIQHAYLEAL